MTSRVWLNGEFCTKPWTQMVPEATQSPPDLIEDEVSNPSVHGLGRPFPFREDEGDSDRR